MARPASKEEAKRVVNRIAKENGHIPDEYLDRIESMISIEERRDWEKQLLAKDRLSGHAILALAKELYSSGARFIFELLQNADDASFNSARANSQAPFVSFKVYRDRIIVECNEDGFTEDDLSSLCTVGRSSKSASHGYIGAKGIGFKSVFIAANKVEVRSGHFSFYFKHDMGDPGLGMVTPVWQDTDEDMNQTLTRMILHRHAAEDSTRLDDLRRSISHQFDNLHEQSLLFLRNIKELKVSHYTDDGKLERSRAFSIGTRSRGPSGVDPHTVLLNTERIDSFGQSQIDTRRYHVTRYKAQDIPLSHSRELAEANEDVKKASSQPEVVLAFPLTPTFEPDVPQQGKEHEKQSIFAFLPVTESNFAFLIQSDFDTTANRQDILPYSSRNIILLDAIASAFVTAVQQFCQDPDQRLCYSWPLFLPKLDDRSSTFWAGLSGRIKAKIEKAAVLKSRIRVNLRTFNELVRVGSDFKDGDGNPLLEDLWQDRFLSKTYSGTCCDNLRAYGLRIMTFGDVFDVLEADLNSTRSRMRNLTQVEWHTSIARVLSKAIANDWNCRLKRMELLPLRNGVWVSILNRSGSILSPVYFPTISGFTIPPDLSIPILSPQAVANVERSDLFVQLGARTPTTQFVRDKIRLVYLPQSGAQASCSLQASKDHLTFLYLTHQPSHSRLEFRWILVFNDQNHRINPKEQDMFLPDDHDYGPQALLRVEDGVSGIPNIKGFPAHFVHPEYLLDPPQQITANHPSWVTWLQNFIGLRQRLRLVSPNGKSLSDTWHHVAQHRPKKLLGMLEHLWIHERAQIENSEYLKSQIRDTPADKLCIHDLAVKLGQTFLPLPDLKRHCSRFMASDEHFPFLDIGDSAFTPQMLSKWTFMCTNFSVAMQDDAYFLTRMLFWISSSKRVIPKGQSKRILELYLAIHEKVQSAQDRHGNINLVKQYFNDKSLILVHSRFSGHWRLPTSCLWEAPPAMVTKHSLKHFYSSFVDQDQLQLLERFFTQTISVPYTSWPDLTQELDHWRGLNWIEFDDIVSLYKSLAQMKCDDKIREEFATKQLIYVAGPLKRGWYKSSECLWSSTTEIRGKVTLNNDYEDLKHFFVSTLNVKTLTLQMMYDELLQTKPGDDVGQVKLALLSFNALLQAEQQKEPVGLNRKKLLQAPIFAIAYADGTKSLTSTKTEFAIPDREYLVSQFRGKIKLLNYDLADIRMLNSFFEWAHLTPRYLSNSVNEVTSVTGGLTWRISIQDRDLKHKARSILRVAATFNSPWFRSNGKELHGLLRNASIRETNNINSVLTITQDGVRNEVRKTEADMHISEEGPNLVIYVPADKKKQTFCFASPLPVAFAHWLMRDPTMQIPDAMITVLTTLLSVDVSVIDSILDHQGIIQIFGYDDDVEADPNPVEQTSNLSDAGDEAEVDANSHDDRPRSSRSRSSSSNETLAASLGEQSADIDNEGSHTVAVTEIARQSHFRREQRSPVHLQSSTIPQSSNIPTEDASYRLILERVVKAARRAHFPSKGIFGTSNFHEGLPSSDNSQEESFDGYEVVTGFRSMHQQERKKKIGAAGELYIFELFKKLGLPYWSYENWESKIRTYVRVLPSYDDMEPWPGTSEKADLNYDDVNGKFTSLLVEMGYLEEQEVSDTIQKYHLEVKTTTGTRRTAFYVSENQIKQMEEAHKAENRMYIILRVFNVENDAIGLSVYVDPERLRRNGKLVFSTKQWSVVPS